MSRSNVPTAQHEWKAPFSGVSRLCGALVERGGYGDDCDLPPEDPIHSISVPLSEESP